MARGVMGGRPSLSVIVLTLTLFAFLHPTEARHFEVKKYGPKMSPCIMADLDYNIEIQAMKKGKLVAAKTLTPDDKDATGKGECVQIDHHEIGVFYKDSSMFAIAFQPVGPKVAMYRVMQFVPQSVFGRKVGVMQVQGFADPTPEYVSESRFSYECDVPSTVKYLTYTNSTGGFSFNVNVNFIYFKTQGYGIENGKYGPAEKCPAAFLSTTAAPTIQPATTAAPTIQPAPFDTTTAVEPVPFANSTPVEPAPIYNASTTPMKPVPIATTTPKPAPTVAPALPVNSYTVKDGKVTCISLQSAITLVVDYPLKGTKQDFKKAVFFIPKTATATGDCRASENTQTLNINFFNDWSLVLTFAKSAALTGPRELFFLLNEAENGAQLSYGISKMALTVVVDEKRFPDSKFLPGTNYTVTSEAKDPAFPQKPAGSDFFRCNSESEDVLTKHVQVKTEHLRFKAFNTDNNAGFGGKEAECSADNHSSKGLSPGAIAGIVIACVAVVAFGVLCIMMVLRRRNANYENIS